MIYFIQDAGDEEAPIKIGYTAADASKRLKELQTGHHAELCVLACIDGNMDAEKEEHRRWAHLRLRGEWFKSAPELREYIGGLPDARPVSAEPQYEYQYHDFVESSGTTMTCRNCGCIRYCCTCCTGGAEEYSTWDAASQEWNESVWTKKPPVCVSGRPVPEWIRNK